MSKRRRANRNATRGSRPAPAAPAAPSPSDPRAEVVEVATRLAALEKQRLVLLQQRDRAVARGREAGVSWLSLAEAAGVSHPSLIERHRTLLERPGA